MWKPIVFGYVFGNLDTDQQRIFEAKERELSELWDRSDKVPEVRIRTCG